MINKYCENRYIRKKIKLSLTDIYNNLHSIRQISTILAICPTATENSWRGVLTATEGLFPNNTFKLPQYYSKQAYTDKELLAIGEIILTLNFEKVVFSGFTLYFTKLIEYLHKKNNVDIYLIYHGSFSTNREDTATAKLLYKIIDLCLQRKIKRIGFVKKGMAETLSEIAGIKTAHILLNTKIFTEIKEDFLEPNIIHIGVFTHNLYRKNIDNQIAAGLLVKNSLVHTRNNYNYEYLINTDRLQYHPFFNNYEDFIALLKSMKINLYVSFSECWGQVITESLACGVPCLASDNSGIFDYDKDLHDLLIVKEFDNSYEIYNKIKDVLKNRELISSKGIEYIKLLNVLSTQKLFNFVNDIE